MVYVKSVLKKKKAFGIWFMNVRCVSYSEEVSHLPTCSEIGKTSTCPIQWQLELQYAVCVFPVMDKLAVASGYPKWTLNVYCLSDHQIKGQNIALSL